MSNHYFVHLKLILFISQLFINLNKQIGTDDVWKCLGDFFEKAEIGLGLELKFPDS